MGSTRTYLDHASTSRPKAPGVATAVLDALRRGCASPGRGGHKLARRAEEMVWQVRENMANLVGAARAEHVIFTAGATEALNLALHGLLSPTDHVIATSYDHNSVLRPLMGLRDMGVVVSIVSVTSSDTPSLISRLEQEARSATRMVVVNHASNVTGEGLPVIEICKWARKRGILVLLDAAQTVGHSRINLQTLPVDLVAFGGHKALLGPFGVGCLVVRDLRIPLRPLMRGGTGLESDSLEPHTVYPTAFEVGTLNTPAIAGLGASVNFITEDGSHATRMVRELARACAEQLRSRSDVLVYGMDERRIAPNVAFNIRGVLPERVAATLDEVHGVAVRSGLHCAPLMHRELGTEPRGAVRASFGYGNCQNDLTRLIAAVDEILARK